jgi:hypothetical protein
MVTNARQLFLGNIKVRCFDGYDLVPFNPTRGAVTTPLHGQGHHLPVGGLDMSKIRRVSKNPVNFLFTCHRCMKPWRHAGDAAPGANFKATPFMQ